MNDNQTFELPLFVARLSFDSSGSFEPDEEQLAEIQQVAEDQANAISELPQVEQEHLVLSAIGAVADTHGVTVQTTALELAVMLGALPVPGATFGARPADPPVELEGD